jgi:hypothetical protein
MFLSSNRLSLQLGSSRERRIRLAVQTQYRSRKLQIQLDPIKTLQA